MAYGNVEIYDRNKITNYLLRLKCLILIKTVISIFMEMTADTMWRCFA